MHKEEHENFPSALEAFFLVIALFAAERVFGALLCDLLLPMGFSQMDIGTLMVFLGNGAVFAALLHYKRMSYAELFHGSRNSVAATLGLLAVPTLLLVPGLSLLMASLEAVLEWLVPMSAWDRRTFGDLASGSVAALLYGCVLAPFLEEMLFRGIILRAFLRQYGRWPAIIGSAALFGLFHLNIYQFMVGLIAGTLLGWLYERSRSLWPCILLHGAYNTLLMVIALLFGGSEAAWDFPLTFWVACIVLAALGAGLLRHLLGERVDAA